MMRDIKRYIADDERHFSGNIYVLYINVLFFCIIRVAGPYRNTAF